MPCSAHSPAHDPLTPMKGPFMSDPDLSAQIAAESDAPTRPHGAPTLYPLASLPRGIRAKFFAEIRDVDPELLGAKPDRSLRAAADAFAAVAAVESALRVVAVDKPGYDKWAAEVDDEVLFDLFSWYFESFQPGEAQPSQT